MKLLEKTIAVNGTGYDLISAIKDFFDKNDFETELSDENMSVCVHFNNLSIKIHNHNEAYSSHQSHQIYIYYKNAQGDYIIRNSIIYSSSNAVPSIDDVMTRTIKVMICQSDESAFIALSSYSSSNYGAVKDCRYLSTPELIMIGDKFYSTDLVLEYELYPYHKEKINNKYIITPGVDIINSSDKQIVAVKATDLYTVGGKGTTSFLRTESGRLFYGLIDNVAIELQKSEENNE